MEITVSLLLLSELPLAAEVPVVLSLGSGYFGVNIPDGQETLSPSKWTKAGYVNANLGISKRSVSRSIRFIGKWLDKASIAGSYAQIQEGWSISIKAASERLRMAMDSQRKELPHQGERTISLLEKQGRNSYWDAKLIFSFLEKLEFGSTTTLESRRTAEVIHLLDYPDENEGGFSGKSLMKLKVILPHKYYCPKLRTNSALSATWQLLRCMELSWAGMPKEKYDPPDPRRMYTIMSSEEAANGKKSHWAELEISGKVRSLSSSLWTLTHLTALHLSDNSLSRIPSDIAKLHNLVYLDLSSNKIRSLPAELGNMVSLSSILVLLQINVALFSDPYDSCSVYRELHLNNNLLRVLPFELGKLFQLQTLGLKGNPLTQDILNLYQEPDGTRRLLNYLLDNLAGTAKRISTEQPPPRSWIMLQEPDRTRPTALFSVMCYNVLCDKYATRQLYGYCPSWALNWEYRKKAIMQEILSCNADIISLQEVETEQYYSFFLVELKERGYNGFFSPKSRARTMSEQERKHVDGCAIFFKTEKFTLVQKHTVEFNQLAMANSEGSEAMLNRVMTKDNIGVAVLLELRKELIEMSSGKPHLGMEKQLVLVANAHMHWDPDYSDVKLVQTMMFLSEVKNIIDKASRSLKPGVSGELGTIPLVLCADLNSLPDSGVVEYLSTGGVETNHKDFKELRYNESLTNFSCNGKNGTTNGRITHGFKLKSAYENGLMPYTNYTFDFKGIIDYIFYSKPQLNILGILGPLDHHWLIENNISGCPHPLIPSDHFSLFAQLELLLPFLPPVNGIHLPGRR
ncbi:CCR4-NOT transcription complex subunit 6 [Turdus rufiventris]|nr:CCR4-NOT transcription complex subunit 6 [Turdus rufiventris]